MRFTLRSMPFSVNFRLFRRNQPPYLLQSFIQCDGEKREDTGVGVKLPDGRFIALEPTEWDIAKHLATSRHEDALLINETIMRLRRELIDAQAKQAEQFKQFPRQYPRPTSKSVRFRQRVGQDPWLVTGPDGLPQWSYTEPAPSEQFVSSRTILAHAMTLFLEECRVVGRPKADGTYKRLDGSVEVLFRRLHQLLTEYHRQPTVEEVTLRWAKEFHRWVLQQPQVGAGRHRDPKLITSGYAGILMNRLTDLMDWLHDKDAIPHNPLAGKTWPAYSVKEQIYLEPRHIEALRGLTLDGRLQATQWWMLLMCYTGMDYPDAKNYVANRAAYEIATEDGVILRGGRNKNGETFCIPLLPEVVALLGNPPRLNRPVHTPVLRKLLAEKIAPLIGFEKRLSPKVARKTCTRILEARGFDIKEISRVLGHKSVSTTTTFYYATSEQTVRMGMRRTGIGIKNLGDGKAA